VADFFLVVNYQPAWWYDTYSSEVIMKKLLSLLFLNLTILIKIKIWEYLAGLKPLWDFDNYYRMSRDILAGANPYTLPYMQASGPPLVILPFVPFTWFSLPLARGLLIGLSLGSIFLTSWLLARKIKPSMVLPTTFLFSFCLLLTFPVRFNFDVGQLNLVVMSFTTLLLTTKNKWLKNILLTLIVTIKTNYVLILFSWLRKQLKDVVVVSCLVFFLILISITAFRVESYQTYFASKAGNYILSSSATVDTDYYNQSLKATLARLELSSLYLWFFILLIIGGSIYLFRTGDLTVGIIFSVLVSPIIWQHYIPVLYPILILMGYEMYQKKHFPVSFFLAVFLLLLHLPGLHGRPVNFFLGLLASHYFWGVCLLFWTRIRWLHKYKVMVLSSTIITNV